MNCGVSSLSASDSASCKVEDSAWERPGDQSSEVEIDITVCLRSTYATHMKKQESVRLQLTAHVYAYMNV
jgi:hypothetical protein